MHLSPISSYLQSKCSSNTWSGYSGIPGIVILTIFFLSLFPVIEQEVYLHFLTGFPFTQLYEQALFWLPLSLSIF